MAFFSRTTRVSRHQKSRTIPVNQSGFTGARYNEWQWHQLGDMQICTLFQTDNHASTQHSVFLQAGCPSCRPTNSVKAPPSNTPIPQLTPLTTPNGIQIQSAISPQFTHQTDRAIDRQMR